MYKKIHILKDKEGIQLSAIVTSANNYDIKLVTDVIDNAVIKRPITTSTSLSTTKQRKRKTHHHPCHNRANNSKSIENKILKLGYVLHMLYKRKRYHEKEIVCPKKTDL